MKANQSNPRNRKSQILWLVVPSLLFILVLAFDLLPFLRGNGEWRWPLRPAALTARILIPILVLGLYVFLCSRWLKAFRRDEPSPRDERWFMLFVIVAAPILQLSLASAVSRTPLLEFFGPTVSVHNRGYFTTAVSTPALGSLLANFPATMPQLPIHAQSHPPGPIIARWLSWQVFQALPALADVAAMPLRTLRCHNPGLMALDNARIASASLGMLLPLLGGLAVWPLYAFAKRVSSARVGAIIALLFPVLPLFAMWMSQWDQVYPLLLFLGLYLAHTSIEKNSWCRALAAGVPLSDLLTRADRAVNAAITESRPDSIGSTAYTATIHDATQVLALAKSIDPQIITIIGGIHPTMMPEETLQQGNGAIDYIVRWEGEYTPTELLGAIEGRRHLSEVKGIAYRKDGKIILTPQREFIQDLDSLSPAWDLLCWADYYLSFLEDAKVPLVSSSRGCGNSCAFCSQQKFWQQTYRARSPKNFVGEIEYLFHRFGVNAFFIADEYPTCDRERWEAILDLLIAKDRGIYLLAETRAGDIVRDEDILFKYRKAGIIHMFIGVESADQAVLDIFKKSQTCGECRGAIRLVNEHHIITECSFILGLPHEPGLWPALFGRIGATAQRPVRARGYRLVAQSASAAPRPGP